MIRKSYTIILSLIFLVSIPGCSYSSESAAKKFPPSKSGVKYLIEKEFQEKGDLAIAKTVIKDVTDIEIGDLQENTQSGTTNVLGPTYTYSKTYLRVPYEATMKYSCINRNTNEVLKTGTEKVHDYIVKTDMGHSKINVPYIERLCMKVNYGCASGNCENGYGRAIFDNAGIQTVFMGLFKNKQKECGYVAACSSTDFPCLMGARVSDPGHSGKFVNYGGGVECGTSYDFAKRLYLAKFINDDQYKDLVSNINYEDKEYETVAPKDVQSYLNRGNHYNKERKYQEAIADFTEVIKQDPNNGNAYNNRAGVYFITGNNQQGCADAQKACDLKVCKTLDLVRSRGYCIPKEQLPSLSPEEIQKLKQELASTEKEMKNLYDDTMSSGNNVTSRS